MESSSSAAESPQQQQQQPQLTVIITLPPINNPSKGKTITSFLTQPSSTTLDQQSQQHELPIQQSPPTPADPEQRFNSFTRFFLTSSTRVLALLGLSLLGLLVFNAYYSSVTTLYELRSPEDNNNDDENNREFHSFIFPLFHKYANSDRDLELKLGKFVDRKTVMSVAMIDDSIQQQKKISTSSLVESSTIFPVKGNVYPHGLYYTVMHVGNPGSTYYLDMDTGSDLTWMQCDAPCKRCAKGPNPLYKPAKANILAPKDKLCAQVQSNHDSGSCESCQQCSYEIEYADLSSSIGVLARDNLHLALANGTLVKPNFVLGCAYDQQGQLSVSPARTDGILGLSRSSISLPSQLASQGVIRNVVGHCIASGAESDGYMFLGDEPVPRRGMTWVPMLNNPSILKMLFMRNLSKMFQILLCHYVGELNIQSGLLKM